MIPFKGPRLTARGPFGFLIGGGSLRLVPPHSTAGCPPCEDSESCSREHGYNRENGKAGEDEWKAAGARKVCRAAPSPIKRFLMTPTMVINAIIVTVLNQGRCPERHVTRNAASHGSILRMRRLSSKSSPNVATHHTYDDASATRTRHSPIPKSQIARSFMVSALPSA